MMYEDALREVLNRVYRNTDDCEMRISKDCYKLIREALEKQIPEKPLNLCGRYFGKAKGGNCPCCGAQTNSSAYTYCRKCGQKLLWE